MPDDDPVPSDAEVAQLLETVNQVLGRAADARGRGRRLRRAAAAGAAGVGGHRARGTRPRTSPGSTCCSGTDRSSSVVGGKLTTYRAMAEETVDAVVGRLGRGAARSPTGAAAAGGRRAAAGAGAGDRAGAAGRPVRHRGAGGRGARPGRRGRRPAGDGGGAAVRRPARGRADASRTCWTGAPGSAWCPPTARGPCRWPSRCWPRSLSRRSRHGVGNVVPLMRDVRVQDCPPWTPTPTGTPSRSCSRTAGGPPRTPPPTCSRRCARARPPRRRLRARHHHRRPGRPGGARPGAGDRRLGRPAGRGPGRGRAGRRRR